MFGSDRKNAGWAVLCGCDCFLLCVIVRIYVQVRTAVATVLCACGCFVLFGALWMNMYDVARQWMKCVLMDGLRFMDEFPKRRLVHLKRRSYGWGANIAWTILLMDEPRK
jgi:hypothetical protein